ncbi:MAG: membrane protein [Cyclobacteriaceae bacterium]|nr:MAG: membrane protein [Cyclobacteriaceae bacterium]
MVAHDLGVTRVEIYEQDQGQYVLTAKLPIDPAYEEQLPELPDGFQFTKEPVVTRQEMSMIIRYEFSTLTSVVTDGVIVLPWKREGAFVKALRLDGTIETHYYRGGIKGINLPLGLLTGNPQSAVSSGRHYFELGVEHILMGWDHLAFVLALCFIASGWRLFKLISVFTIGHSITLGLATLGLVNVPVPPVEACIALSIVFVARDALINPKPCHGFAIVLIFGLLHGLGFASALSEVGIGRNELIVGLLTFNLGVEVGQLLFVLGIMLLIRIAGSYSMPFQATFRLFAAYVIGALGIYWFIERVIGFSGII